MSCKARPRSPAQTDNLSGWFLHAPCGKCFVAAKVGFSQWGSCLMMMTTFRQRQNIRSRTLYRKFLLTQRDKFRSREVEATKSFYLMTLDGRNQNNFGCSIFQAVMMTMTMLSSRGQRPRSLHSRFGPPASFKEVISGNFGAASRRGRERLHLCLYHQSNNVQC